MQQKIEQTAVATTVVAVPTSPIKPSQTP